MTDTAVDSTQSVYDVVYHMVGKMAPKKKTTLTASTLLDDIGMDSLETLSLAMDLEEHYELYIPDEDVAAFRELKDVSDYLENALQLREARTESERYR